MESLELGIFDVLNCEEHEEWIIDVLPHFDNRKSVEVAIYVDNFNFLLYQLLALEMTEEIISNII